MQEQNNNDLQQQFAAAYQPLFDLLSQHGLTLLKSEMDEIIRAAEQVKINMSQLNKPYLQF